MKTLIIRSGIDGLNLEGKNYRTFNKLSDKIEDDNIECSYLTPGNTYMALITSGSMAYCFRMPNYEAKWTLDIKLSNEQIARIMSAFKIKGLSSTSKLVATLLTETGSPRVQLLRRRMF